MSETPEESRGNRGRFQPGQSGNPGGRPKGSLNKTTQFCAELLGDNAADVMKTVIDRAKDGHGTALRLCVERLLPAKASRDRSVDLDLPEAATAVDLVHAAAAVIQQAAAGAISLSESKEVLGLLEAQRKLIETANLAVRLEVLESRMIGPAGAAPGESPELAARVRRLLEEGPYGLGGQK